MFFKKKTVTKPTPVKPLNETFKLGFTKAVHQFDADAAIMNKVGKKGELDMTVLSNKTPYILSVSAKPTANGAEIVLVNFKFMQNDRVELKIVSNDDNELDTKIQEWLKKVFAPQPTPEPTPVSETTEEEETETTDEAEVIEAEVVEVKKP